MTKWIARVARRCCRPYPGQEGGTCAGAAAGFAFTRGQLPATYRAPPGRQAEPSQLLTEKPGRHEVAYNEGVFVGSSPLLPLRDSPVSRSSTPVIHTFKLAHLHVRPSRAERQRRQRSGGDALWTVSFDSQPGRALRRRGPQVYVWRPPRSPTSPRQGSERLRQDAGAGRDPAPARGSSTAARSLLRMEPARPALDAAPARSTSWSARRRKQIDCSARSAAA